MIPTAVSLGLRTVTVTLGIIALGLMADVYDEFEPLEYATDPTGQFNIKKEMAFLSLIILSTFVSIMFLALALFKVQIASIDAAFHGLILIVASVGWGMYAGWVADIENVYNKGGLPSSDPHTRWIAKAVSILVLMGINIPLYLTITLLAIKNSGQH